MKTKSKWKNRFILFCICFIAATTSCSSQSTIRLKYTSAVRAILEDSKGNIWFGSHSEGACLFHEGKLQYFTTKNGLSDDQVRNIYEDKNGMIWLECGRGLSVYDGQKMSVYKERDYGSKNEWKPRDGDLWFKGDETAGYNSLEGGPGAYQYDGKKLSYRRFPLKTKTGTENWYSVSTGFVRGKKGTLWFGSYGALIGHDGAGFKIMNDSSLGLNDATGHLHIRSIMEDSKGNLWIGNNGIGVLKYDGKEMVNFTAQQKLKKQDTKGNSLESVFSIGEDASGDIWFGTRDFGAWRYDGKSVKNFTAADGLDSKFIWVIYKSKKGELWFAGDNPSGVYRFNGKSFERIY